MSAPFPPPPSAPELTTSQPSAAERASLEQFVAVSSIFDAAEMVVYVADIRTYELLFLNSGGERLWGSKWSGRKCYEVLQANQESPCAFCTNDRLTLDGVATNPVVWEFQNTVNHRWYLCIDKAIPWSDGRLVRMEVAIDISKRKEEARFREQYVGLISHDMRAPLSAIALAATLLGARLNRGAGLAETTRPLETIRRNTNRISEMIEDLLETTQLESGHLRLHRSVFNLGALAQSVAAQLEETTSRVIRCHVAGPATVFADAGRLERVLENLIGNALRYSLEDSVVNVYVEPKDQDTVVKVVDEGGGIAAEEIPNLFQRFYRAKENKVEKGLGLGLYNSRLIVEHHGGSIWASSQLGTGSTFGFTLPLFRLAAAPAPPPPMP